jgi:hypothetical protein
MSIHAEEILECVKSIKIKNCERHDKIIGGILIDITDHVITPLTQFFQLMYTLNQIPE